MIGYYNYTVWLTFIGMLSSVTGMGLAIQGKIIPAVICLMFSGFCDMFDGIVARTKKDRTDEEKRFGIQLDSLSDIVCFGVLPFVIGVCMLRDDSEKKRQDGCSCVRHCLPCCEYRIVHRGHAGIFL